MAGAIILKNTAFLFWVGDVKIIHVRNQKVLFETHSHTLINQMIENGNVINKIERYKHVVTRSISGNIKEGVIDCHSVSKLLLNDLVVICSDGVSDLLNSYQINTIFNSTTTVQEGINQIEALCEIEAKDNFSMIVVQV